MEAVMAVSSDPQPPIMQAHRTGAGVPLVLVGGGLTGWLSWEPHQQRLAASRDVARLQLLSVQYGLEDRELPADYSVKLESQALAAALDGLGWADAIDLVAWSYGALVSLDFALTQPERIRTLTLIEPPAFWVLSDEARADPVVLATATVLRSLHGEITEDQLGHFAAAVGLVPPGAEASSLPQWPLWVNHRRSLRNSSVPLDHTDDHVRLARFRRPVLLVTGTGTPTWLRHITDALAERFPHASIVEMPAGHAPQLVSMDRFLDVMGAFHRAPEP
jgi:pimeloyl-ACP methyl ester carboxylesterase